MDILPYQLFYGLHNGSTRGADQIRRVKSRASISGELMVGAFPSFLAGFHMAYKIEKHIAKYTLADFCRRNHIKKLSLFGSALHGGMQQGSDIDLLVEFEENYIPGFFALCRMENELSDLLGRKVDLRTPQELSRYFRDEVVRTAEVQYEA